MRLFSILTLLVVFTVVAVAAGMRMAERPAIVAARDTVRITDTLYRAAKVEAEKHEPGTTNAVAAASVAAELAQVVEPGKIELRTTLAAPPSVVVVPVQLTDRITKQQLAIDSLSLLASLRQKALDAADSTIRARDKLIARLTPSTPWGVGATCGVDPFTREPRCTVGVTYRAQLPHLSLPFRR